MFFLASGRERFAMGCIVNRLVESVHHNDASVRGDTITLVIGVRPFKDSQEMLLSR